VTWVYGLDHPFDLSRQALTDLLGGKGTNLWVMRRELGLSVPPAIVVTTEACRAFLRDGWPDALDEELRDGLAGIGAAVGRRFGDPADPLLVSVRSGAPASMPGMMDTILDVGLTEAGIAGLASFGGDAFARDCSVRLDAMFRSTVGGAPPDDAWAQLRAAVEAVFRSWRSARAVAYRTREGIVGDSGTAVVIQAMVFGNRGPSSATGVVFTRNPATGEPGLYGDVLFGAQGEDVVAGSHATLPVAALDGRLPAAAADLRGAATILERHFADLCDIEFTIEDGRLWLLQVRVGKRAPRAALRIASDMARDPGFPLSRAAAVQRVASLLRRPPLATTPPPAETPALTRGLGASPGIASGAIATSPEEAIRLAEAGRAAILVRAETSPDDVHGMARSAGVLTASGGLTSHAAVVARGWGIPAVVGASELVIRDDQVRVAGAVLRRGDILTIDGDDGRVFRGVVGATTEVAPEARELLDWARELDIDVSDAATGPADTRASTTPRSEATPAETEAGDPPATSDECLLAIGVKGFATREATARALLVEPIAVEPLVEELVAGAVAVESGGILRLTEAGRARRAELVAGRRATLGETRADDALDAFLAIDRRVKDIVTDWQMRPTDGGPVLNDHSDPTWDAGVLERLAAVDADAVAWIDALERDWPAARRYHRRLAEAMDGIRAGDHRFLASPRVDSYHGIWFELHEDLILLAGRTRADEVAAGRA
jgi:pyruvate,orthophosphate dikinase